MGDRAEQVAQRRSQIPKKYRGTYDRAVAGRSLRAAINAFCLECCGYLSHEVANCTSSACPLWAVRPFQTSKDFSGNGLDGGLIDEESSEQKQLVLSYAGENLRA